MVAGGQLLHLWETCRAGCSGELEAIHLLPGKALRFRCVLVSARRLLALDALTNMKVHMSNARGYGFSTLIFI